MRRAANRRVKCHVCGRDAELKPRMGAIGPHYLVDENGKRRLCLGTDQQPRPTTEEARKWMSAQIRVKPPLPPRVRDETSDDE